MKTYSDISNRYLLVQKRRTILTIIGIILSVALISSVGTLFISIRDMQIKQYKQSGDYHFVYKNQPINKVEKVAGNVNVEGSSYRIKAGFALPKEPSKEYTPSSKTKDDDTKYLDIMKFNESSFKMFPLALKEGRLPNAENEILLEYWVLNQFKNKPKVGDTIIINLGIIKDKETGRILTSEDNLQQGQFTAAKTEEYKLVGLIKPDFISSYNTKSLAIGFIPNGFTSSGENNTDIYVRVKNPSDSSDLSIMIAKQADLVTFDNTNDNKQSIQKNNNYNIKYNEPLLSMYAGSTSSSVNMGIILVAIFFIILIIISTIAVIYNAFNISVLERISQFGIIRCVGSSPNQIRKIVFKEALIIGIIGIPAGLIFGVFAMKIVFMIIKKILGSEIAGSISLDIVISYPLMLISILIGFFTIIISSYGPAKKAGKVSALEAVRNTGGFKKEKFKKAKKAFITKLLFKIEGDLAFKNLRRNRSRFRITVFSMVISICLFIVFGTFADSLFNMGVVGQGFTPSLIPLNKLKKGNLIDNIRTEE
jgi:putative ABC transport system permease protein